MKTKGYYISWGIKVNGIFLSQVIDTCNHLCRNFDTEIVLISFVPYLGFFDTRKSIKKNYSKSIVLPMIPSRNHWWFLSFLTLFFLNFFKKKNFAIARAPISYMVGDMLKKTGLVDRLIYDGRGAAKAEFKEYNLSPVKNYFKKVQKWEQKAVLESDFRIAVSKKLIDYWNKEYFYEGVLHKNHEIIPCTISASKCENLNIDSLRTKYSFCKDDTIFVYSGSNQGWQSLSLLVDFFEFVLLENPNNKLLLLTNMDFSSHNFYNNNKNRIKKYWVAPNKVSELLSISDYGILIRENTITNKVAAPTKFAEYLNAGNKIIISPNIGDYSDMVIDHDLGFIYNENYRNNLKFRKLKQQERNYLINKSRELFSKSSFKKSYKNIVYNVK